MDREEPAGGAAGSEVWAGDSDVGYVQHRYHCVVVGRVVSGCPFCSSSSVAVGSGPVGSPEADGVR